MELRGASKMVSVAICLGDSSSSILKTKLKNERETHTEPVTTIYDDIHLPTTSTNVEIFCPPGNCTVA